MRYQSEESLGSYVPFQDCADRILGKDLLDTIRVVVLRRPTNHSYHGKNAGPHTALQPMNHAPPGLDGLEALWYLDVSNTDFDDRYLARLRGLRDVGVLDVRFTNVTDEGLGNIGGLSELAILRLAGRNISDVGLNQLSHVGSLKDLYLTDTAVTDAGVAAFRRAVPDCKVYLDEY